MRSKFVMVILFTCLFLTGCTSLQEMSLEEIVDNGTNQSVVVYNKYRKGYKYNLPKGLGVYDSTEYNEIIMSSNYTYYLYVDAVSYYNKIIETYKENDISYYSKAISFEDKYGYLEINETDDGKYFIEIMYNYAKIEVIVEFQDINIVVANSLSILSSITFNDNVLKTLLDEETSQFREFEFNIFETSSTESEYLQAVESDIYEEDDEIHDSDLIN